MESLIKVLSKTSMVAHVDKLKCEPIYSLSVEKLQSMGIPKIDAEVILDEIEWIWRKEVYLLLLRKQRLVGMGFPFSHLARYIVGDLQKDIERLTLFCIY